MTIQEPKQDAPKALPSKEELTGALSTFRRELAEVDVRIASHKFSTDRHAIHDLRDRKDLLPDLITMTELLICKVDLLEGASKIEEYRAARLLAQPVAEAAEAALQVAVLAHRDAQGQVNALTEVERVQETALSKLRFQALDLTDAVKLATSGVSTSLEDLVSIVTSNLPSTAPVAASRK